MKWKLLLVALLAFILFPTPAGAVDFTISDVQINAQLQPDGTVQVNEQHTYEFDSKFKGIIREIKPKTGTSIVQFEAYENGNRLKVDKKNDEYRVHRKGKKETIDFELSYQIKDGMQKYEDGAEFYWPFFDDRNETDYGNMTITVTPPDWANDVLFLGYHSAEEKGALQEGGRVVFALGEVDSGENGDIRVVYEPSLFPGMQMMDGKIRPDVEADRKLQEIERAKYAANRERTKTFGGITLGAGLLIVVLISAVVRSRKNRYVKDAQAQISSHGFFVPAYDMSLPATLFFKKGAATVELMSAALLDLVRKGYVRQLSDEKFELVDANVDHDHEQQLIQLLFFQVGSNERFTLSQLKAYTKDEKNYDTFQNSFTMWQQLLKHEMKQYDLKESSARLRWILALLGLAGVTLAIFFGAYDLYILMFTAIILALYTLVFILFYSPHNFAGILMLMEWMQVENWMNDMNTEKWEALSTDDRFRVLVYGVGIKHPELESYYEEFASIQKRLNQNQYADNGIGGSLVYNPVFLSGSFNQASSNVSSNAPSSSSSGGGGTGGGGGGSGAF
ncbi:DUF2207 domain-containing protein [Mammaliicoccus sciuri]